MRELRKDVAEIKAAIHSKAYSHVAAAPPPTAVSAKTTKPTPRELESARRGAEPRIVLKTQHLPEQHPARAEVPSQLLQRIAPHLSAQLQTQALSVGRLHSGDLKISVASKAEENRVLDEANEEWLRLAFDPEEVSPEVRRPLFPEHKTIAVHGVPFYLGNDGIKADVERVHGIIITSARFFLGQHRRESLQKSNKRQFGSAAVAFKTQEDRDRFLKSGKISCGISRCTVEPYLSRTHPAMREMPTAWSRRALLQKTAGMSPMRGPAPHQRSPVQRMQARLHGSNTEHLWSPPALRLVRRRTRSQRRTLCQASNMARSTAGGPTSSRRSSS
ncbi:unnamed protein product [Tilletia controversa]|nr:unnamed protein product [Tilletia controversa]